MNRVDEGPVRFAPGKYLNSHIFFKNDGYYYKIRELHAHEPDHLLIEDMELRRAIIHEARTSVLGQSLKRMLNDFKVRCGDPQLAMRFTTARMAPAMYAARSANYPKIPRTLLHLGILLGLPNMQALCRTVDGTDLLFRGVIGVQQDRTVCVVFISGRMLQLLQSLKSLHGDGTFKKRPRKPRSAQIYNIVTKFGGVVICVLRALMMSRTQAAYVTLFSYIKELAPRLDPDRIHSDFERGQMNAWRISFPRSVIVGCLWHYGVACSSQARTLGLAPLAHQNNLVYTYIRCLSGAPLLPQHLILVGVLEIWEEVVASGLADTLRDFFQYFEREWAPRTGELSVYRKPERTNNCSESDNHMMANMIPQNHPNVWHMTGAFVRLEHLAWCDKLAVEASRAVNNPRRWRTVWNDARLERLAVRLEDGEITPGQFLHSASWSNLAALHHGLRFNRNESSDEESDPDDV